MSCVFFFFYSLTWREGESFYCTTMGWGRSQEGGGGVRGEVLGEVWSKEVHFYSQAHTTPPLARSHSLSPSFSLSLSPPSACYNSVRCKNLQTNMVRFHMSYSAFLQQFCARALLFPSVVLFLLFFLLLLLVFFCSLLAYLV